MSAHHPRYVLRLPDGARATCSCHWMQPLVLHPLFATWVLPPVRTVAA